MEFDTEMIVVRCPYCDKEITLTKKQKWLTFIGVLLVIIAPFLWCCFLLGTINVIDFSSEEVEYVQINCSHYPEHGTIYASGEIQALIHEANAMLNKERIMLKSCFEELA